MCWTHEMLGGMPASGVTGVPVRVEIGGVRGKILSLTLRGGSGSEQFPKLNSEKCDSKPRKTSPIWTRSECREERRWRDKQGSFIARSEQDSTESREN